tara:strand:+ start:140 stop:361 length:222 start_codon:yes stop_codon:yes gene_type:complete
MGTDKMLVSTFEELKAEEKENDRLMKQIKVLRYDREELREAVEYWRTRAELFVTQARVLGQQIEQIKAVLGGA